MVAASLLKRANLLQHADHIQMDLLTQKSISVELKDSHHRNLDVPGRLVAYPPIRGHGFR